MATNTPATISVEHIFIPDGLPAFMQTLYSLPNCPPSLYLTVSSSTSLVIYVAPASQIAIIKLSELRTALDQQDQNALALKSLLEHGPKTKVFFDARDAAKVLFERSADYDIEVCVMQSEVHEVQLMELTSRQRGRNGVWLAGFDKCIMAESKLDLNQIQFSDYGTFDKRILHLPILWGKYHALLLKLKSGSKFWISEVRCATKKRLDFAHGKKHPGHNCEGARIWWDSTYLDEATDSWNEDILSDAYSGGDYLGGAEHWSLFNKL
ncbi:hypothetical protein EJ05DRAFT_502441 [Pseudovirgaria hyperparasitica]|uniref:3'-5' exonuclease domain-containing protein n=1 Tax=Pseudovirgaria hyperparasitica TaxID=470096 RepID=A0A6A6W303_9PEZI|nr:uncharacterized protein EJ05DRAFT_502441 [Pseudovirgaria hyperparasitica]KAF2755967.1 hypothetical protein EJ05DRAFT_502441 [Pseudovirgaria hyperparasitica]